ncbi:MAG: aminodeoxychorismate lyase [Agathobacter sp.]|nr:aminodeoxychorismate lyase [Agathobacter sp.]
MDFNKFLFGFIKIAFSVMMILLVIYVGVGLCRMGYDFGYRVFTEPAMEMAPGQDVLVQVRDDMSSKEIGQMLEDKGLVRDSRLFFLQYRLSAYYGKIKSEVYTLNTSMTPKEMIVYMATNVPEESTQIMDNTAAEEEGSTEVELGE